MMWDIRPYTTGALVVNESNIIIADVPAELVVQWRDLVAQANQLFDKADIIETRKKQLEFKL